MPHPSLAKACQNMVASTASTLSSGLYRRLRLLTGSADPFEFQKALAGSSVSRNTAGQEFHPALSTSYVRRQPLTTHLNI